MNSCFKKAVHNLRKKISLSDWFIEPLNLPLAERASTEPELILIQIDGLSYSKFMDGLKKAGVDLNRKMLSELAIHDPEGFKGLVETAKAAISS